MNHYLLVWVALLVGCSKPSSQIDPEPETLVPERVIVDFKPVISTRQGFDLVSSHKLSVSSLNIRYVSSLPADSLAYVTRHMYSKPYFVKPNFTDGTTLISYVDSTRRIEAFVVLQELTATYQKDWLSTIEHLHLSVALNGPSRWQLSVEKGREKQWASEFNKSSLVDTAYVEYFYK